MQLFKKINKKYTILTIAGALILSIAGCGVDEPDCAANTTKKIIANIVKDNTTGSSLIAVMVSGNSKQAKELSEKLGGRTEQNWREYEVIREDYANNLDEAMKNAEYSINNIIMTDRNATTKKVACKASLQAAVPGWGSGSINVKYNVEINSDGGPVVELFGLR